MQEIVIGGGCFWCVEALLQKLEGVLDTRCGYMGGTKSNPTYEEVCSGTTGHAEVVRVQYDKELLTLQELITTLFSILDPTTPNRQGVDVGTQYRSAIFYRTKEQKDAIESALKLLQKHYEDPIVIQVAPMEEFFEAESYHQAFYTKHPYHGYCQAVIAPKLTKLTLIRQNKKER